MVETLWTARSVKNAFAMCGYDQLCSFCAKSGVVCENFVYTHIFQWLSCAHGESTKYEINFPDTTFRVGSRNIVTSAWCF